MDRPATRDDMYQAYSDDHKALYGVRARFAADWSFEELAEGLEMLREEMEADFSAPDHGEGWSYEGDARALEL